eukprot:5593167-Amphidinium_carterae.1
MQFHACFVFVSHLETVRFNGAPLESSSYERFFMLFFGIGTRRCAPWACASGYIIPMYTEHAHAHLAPSICTIETIHENSKR